MSIRGTPSGTSAQVDREPSDEEGYAGGSANNSRRDDRRGIWAAVLGMAAVLAAAPLVAAAPLLAAGAAVALSLAVLVVAHPPFAAYVFLATTPLIVGIDRGELLPLLRPNEAVLVLLWGALGLRLLLELARGRLAWPRSDPVGITILLMAVASSMLPLLWLTAQGETITRDDLLYALTLWKYYGIYLIFRGVIRTERQVTICLHIAMLASAAVAVVAILQALNLFGVPDLLAGLYAPFGDEAALEIRRGTSTIASSIAVADVMVFSMAIAVGYLVKSRRHRWSYTGAAALFVLGTLAAGQFSGLIGLVVAGVAVGAVTGYLGRVALVGIPTLMVAGLALAPVLERRLEGFSSPAGLPRSWIGRLDNLRTFFWPRLFEDWNFLFGVQPSSRVEAPESWREWVWIESGHTWLLWNGGIPFLLAFFAFLWASIRKTWGVARQRADAVSVAAVASFTALCVIAVLMTLDPHLTMRGSADLSFPLLALACAAGSRGGASSDPSKAEADAVAA